MAVSNFGFGGTNAAVLVEGTSSPHPTEAVMTRFIFGRTRGALEMYASSEQLSEASPRLTTSGTRSSLGCTTHMP